MTFKGQRVAGYVLEERIGSGATGVVYRAYQPQLDRRVAIKVLEVGGDGRTDDQRRFRERFRRETQAVAALHHPNILTIHDYGEDGDMAFIVMDYVPRGSLEALTAQGALAQEHAATAPAAVALAAAVGDALAYAHGQAIIHGDLKPSNILLPRPDWPLVADFGLAGGRQHRALASTQVSLKHASIFTRPVSYLSPEQVSEEPVDHRADIYSLGLILFEMLTGALPFMGKTAAASMMRRLHEDPPAPSALNTEIPEAVSEVVLRSLARDPDERYSDMTAFVNDLQAAHTASGAADEAHRTSQDDHVITMELQMQPELVGPRLFIATSGVVLPIPVLEQVLIGRNDPARMTSPDLNLEPYGGGSAGVSRQHAKLLRREDGWYIEDQRSTNGTYLNEVRLLPYRPVRLRSGDLLRFSHLTLVFEEA